MADFLLKEESLAVFSIMSVVILFYLYYKITAQRIFYDLLNRIVPNTISRMSVGFIAEKLAGILMTGVVPFIIFIIVLRIEPERVGLKIGRTGAFWYFSYLLPLVAVFFSFISSRNPKFWTESPQLRVKNWCIRHIILSVAFWFVYIFGYEFFFRGVLWFLCYNAFGFWSALLINIILYSIIHLPKGIFMVTGSVPLGIVFCCLSSLTGSFYPAFIIHASMAITTELSSVYHNPEFKLFVRKVTIV
jgi:membrane protease YdiL (CAAX protease family)